MTPVSQIKEEKKYVGNFSSEGMLSRNEHDILNKSGKLADSDMDNFRLSESGGKSGFIPTKSI